MSSSEAKHILVVDDDPKVRRLLRRCFEGEGYRVSEAATEAEISARLARGDIDLITLDLALGAEDGLAIARRLRTHSDVPIVMVTGKGDPIDTVVGLELGADDYISKPFHVREVVARIRSVIRRTAPARTSAAPTPAGRRYHFGDWVADMSTLTLTSSNGASPELTSGDFRLLEVFLSNPRQVLTRDQLMDRLRGQEWTPTDRSIDNRIARLRRKIESNPRRPELIKTVRGIGYSFAVDVTVG